MSPGLDGEKFFIVARGEAVKRIDAFYWQPKFHVLDTIFARYPDWTVRLGSIATGITNGDHGGVEYTDKGVRYLRGQSVTEFGLDLAKDQRFISEAEHSRMVRAEVLSGDVLYTIAGSVGNACVVGGIDRANINQAIVRVRPFKHIIPQYLADFLNSSLGRLQGRRVANGGVQLNINFSEVRSLRILAPPLDKQRRLVDELSAARASYRSALAQAARLLESVDDYLLAELGIALPPEPENTLTNRIFTAQRRELAGWRFDPQALHPEREGCIAELQRRPFHSLRKAASFCRDLRKEIPDGVIYVGLENIESHTGRYIPSSDKESVSSAFAFRKGQVLFPKLRPYLNKVFLAPFDGLCSTEFHVLEGVTVCSEFLALFLRSNLVVKQTKHLMSGNTLPRLQTEDIETLLIPDVDDLVQQRIISKAEHWMAEAEQLRQHAETELEAAKRRIEAMLLGEPV